MKNHKEEPPKIEQTEGDKTFMVFCYPDELIPIMDSIVDKFFHNKELTAERHSQYLLEQANPEAAKSANKRKQDEKPQRKSNFKNAAGKGKPQASKTDNNKKAFSGQNRKDFKQDGGFKRSGNFANDRNFANKAKPAAKVEIPTATVLRKRKTTTGTVPLPTNLKQG